MENPPTTPLKNPKKKILLIIISIITVLVLAAGLAAGLALVGQRQIFKQKAAVSGGTAKIYLSPEEKTINKGDSFNVKIYFDTSGNTISALTAQLEYSYSGSEPPISVDNVTINPTLAVNNMWDFPINSHPSSNGTALIKIAGFSGSVDGYSTSGQEELATITFKGNSAGTINVTFNSAESKITKKSDGVDILMIPQSTGTYTVSGESDDNEPTPTATPTPTPIGNGPVATYKPVPQTGMGKTTLVSLGFGITLVLASLLIAF